MFAVLHDTGMRIGEALGLRHEDWAARLNARIFAWRIPNAAYRSSMAAARSADVIARFLPG